MARSTFRRRGNVSKTTICNMALSKLGSTRVQLANIQSDNSEIAQMCDFYYNIVLEELVRMHSWNCCKKRSILYPYSYSFTSYNVYQADGSSLTRTERGETFLKPNNMGQRKISLILDDVDLTGLIWDSDTAFKEYKGHITPSYSQYSRQAIQAGEITVPSYIDPNGSAVTNAPHLYAQRANVNSATTESYWTLEKEKILTYKSGLPVAYEKLRIPLADNFFPRTGTFNTNSFPAYNVGDVAYDYTIERDKSTFGYDYIFGLPYDSVRVLAITTNERQPLIYQDDFLIEDQCIHANCEYGYLLYDGIPNEYEMDSLFRRAFATLLASTIAVSITGQRNLEISLRQEFDNIIMPEARRVNGFEMKLPPTIDSEWLEATFSSNSFYNNSLPPFAKASYGTFE